VSEPQTGTSAGTRTPEARASAWEPHVVEAPEAGHALADWIAPRADEVDELLREHFAVLLRGFVIGSAEGFGRVLEAIGHDPLQYTQRSTRRTREAEGVYTSTEYPPALPIALHSENSFQSEWPRRITFCSLVVADTGGITPLADNAAVYRAIPDAVKQEFLRRQIKYVRNFGGGLELPWQEAFQSERREDVEDYCAQHDIAWTWKTGDRLMTEQVLPAAIMSPARGDPLWLNQAHLFHVTNIAPEIREALLRAMPASDLPRHAYFGDGAPIPDEHMDAIRSAYEASTVRVPWQVDDLLLVDNMHVAHGRDPFTGNRKVLVAMSDLLSFGDCEVVTADGERA